MDEKKFQQAIKNAKNTPKRGNGIGTLSEKTLHIVLKHYFEPCENHHEIKVHSFVADIVNENGIIEIQTGNFDKLRKKLEAFLKDHIVTIVYPVAYTKWLLWIDKNTGEITNKRKSPKRGSPYEAFSELYKIKWLLQHENLKLNIVMVDIEEYRYLKNAGIDRKKGFSRCERIPVRLIEEIKIESERDYCKLIPKCLYKNFTSKDYKTESGLSLSEARTALHVLHHLNVVRKAGKKGNLILYDINN